MINRLSKWFSAILLAALLGCSSLEQARNGPPRSSADAQTRCERLDRTYRNWGTVAVISGGMAAGIESGAIPESEYQTGLAVTGLGLVAVSGGAAWASSAAQTRYVEEGCAR